MHVSRQTVTFTFNTKILNPGNRRYVNIGIVLKVTTYRAELEIWNMAPPTGFD